MKDLRVAYVINDAAFFVSHRLPIALRVIESGGAVCLITGYNLNKEIEKVAQNKLKQKNIEFHQCYFSQSLGNPLFELIGFFQLIKILKKFNPTTIHSATAKGNLLASVATNFLYNVKLILSVSGLATLFVGKQSKKQTLFYYIFKFFFSVALKRINYTIIFQNKEDLKVYKSIINLNNKNLKIIYGSGVDTTKIKPLYKKIKSRNILLPARILYEKGVEEYVMASKLLKDQNIDGKFYLAGTIENANPSSINFEKVKNWVSEGLILYAGYQYNIYKLYKDIDIVCLPSWREGFPKVLMEAAAFGLPVITTDAPGCKDAVIHNKTGIIVPVRNAIKLSNAIKNLFENEDLRIKMGKENRKVAEKNFDLDVILPQILKLYK